MSATAATVSHRQRPPSTTAIATVSRSGPPGMEGATRRHACTAALYGAVSRPARAMLGVSAAGRGGFYPETADAAAGAPQVPHSTGVSIAHLPAPAPLSFG